MRPSVRLKGNPILRQTVLKHGATGVFSLLKQRSTWLRSQSAVNPDAHPADTRVGA